MKNKLFKILGLLAVCFGLVASIPSAYCSTSEETSTEGETSVSDTCEHMTGNVLTHQLTYYCPQKYEVTSSYFYMTRDLFNIESPQFNYCGGRYDKETQQYLFRYQCKDHIGLFYEQPGVVNELTDDYKIMAVVNETGDIYFITHESDYDETLILTNITDFITKVLEVTEANVQVSYDKIPTTSTNVGTYVNGNIYLRVESKRDMLNSSMENPVVYERLGYFFPEYGYKTEDVSLEEAIKLAAENCFTLDGNRVEEYTYTTKTNNGVTSITFKDSEGNTIFIGRIYFDDIFDLKGFVYTADKYGINMFFDSRESQKDISEKYNYVMRNHYNSTMKYDYELDIKDGLDHSLERVIRSENDRVYVMQDINFKCTTFRDLKDEPFLKQIKYGFTDLFKNFGDNKPLQIASYAFGSILTLFIMIGVIKLFTKGINVFKR